MPPWLALRLLSKLMKQRRWMMNLLLLLQQLLLWLEKARFVDSTCGVSVRVIREMSHRLVIFLSGTIKKKYWKTPV